MDWLRRYFVPLVIISIFGLSTIAYAATPPLTIGQGGTGWNTFVDHTVILGSSGLHFATTSPSSAGFVLTSNGVNADPTFQALSTGSLSLTKGNFLVGNDAGVAQATSSIFITSTGQVGVGLTSIASVFEVKATSTASTGQAFIAWDSANKNLFQITNNGNVGLSTSSPSQLLSLQGNALLSGDITSVANITATGTVKITPLTTGSVLFAGAGGAVSQSNSNFFWDNSNSRLGVGTTSPASTLALQGANNQSLTFGTLTDATSFVGFTTDGVAPAIANYVFTSNGTGAAAATILNSPGGTTQLRTNNVQRLTVLNSGFIGISSTTPNALLALGSVGGFSTAGMSPNGYILSTASTTITDTVSSGTVAIGSLSSFERGTIAASNATTFTRAATVYIAGVPIAGANVTSAGGRSLYALGLAEFGGGLTIIGGALSANTTGAAAVNIQTTSATALGTWGNAQNLIALMAGRTGVGTTTPGWVFQIATSTQNANGTWRGGQLALTDLSQTAASNLQTWLFGSQGGNLYIGTSTGSFGTSTPAALTILNAGNFGLATSSPFSTLSVAGNISTTPFTISTTSSTLASSTLFMIDRSGDLHLGGGTPVLSGCGTAPTLDANSTDQAGSITFGATASGCTLTFQVPKVSAPHCVVSTEAQSLVNAYTYTENTTTLVITQAASGGTKWDYICVLGH